MFSGKTIFIAPLDWGLGHATRCVPIIHTLSENNTLILGVTPLNTAFFSTHFPDLQKVEVPSYRMSYSRYLPLWLKLLAQVPKIWSVFREEKKGVERIISQHNVDVIISDSRYGLVNKNVYSILMTHQLTIKAPFGSFFANRMNSGYVRKFDEVWVPDYEEKNSRLSGELSDPGKINIPVNYIGPKSALVNLTGIKTDSEKFDYLILLSGVEPQRTLLENILLKRAALSKKKIALVRGSNSPISTTENLKLIDFSFAEQLKELIVNADTVICRSGYSTLMDLHLLNKKKIILIPTPGQTEQEYLASYWSKKFGCEILIQAKAEKFDFN